MPNVNTYTVTVEQSCSPDIVVNNLSITDARELASVYEGWMHDSDYCVKSVTITHD